MSSKSPSALVTGCGSGFGQHLAERLAAQGYSVTVADIKQKAAEAVVDSIKRNGGQAQAVYCDTSQYSDQQAMFKAHAEAYGSLDVTMLNAGILERGSFLDDDIEHFNRYLSISLMGIMQGVRLASQTMSSLGSTGVILITSSSVAFMEPASPYPCYRTAKLGTLGLMHDAAPMLAKKGQRIGAVAPTMVNTGLIYEDGLLTGKRWKELEAFPAAALCPISLVGDAFLHLIDDKEANGTIIRVEGATPGGEDKPFTIEEVQLSSRVVRTIKQLDKPKPGQAGPGDAEPGKAENAKPEA